MFGSEHIWFFFLVYQCIASAFYVQDWEDIETGNSDRALLGIHGLWSLVHVTA